MNRFRAVRLRHLQEFFSMSFALARHRPTIVCLPQLIKPSKRFYAVSAAPCNRVDENSGKKAREELSQLVQFSQSTGYNLYYTSSKTVDAAPQQVKMVTCSDFLPNHDIVIVSVLLDGGVEDIFHKIVGKVVLVRTTMETKMLFDSWKETGEKTVLTNGVKLTIVINVGETKTTTLTFTSNGIEKK